MTDKSPHEESFKRHTSTSYHLTKECVKLAMGWGHIGEGPELIICQINPFGEKLTEKMFIEASRKSSLQIARLYLIDSSSFLKTLISSGFLCGLVILENPYASPDLVEIDEF